MKILPLTPKSNYDRIKGFIRIIKENQINKNIKNYSKPQGTK